jgi:hypothetical protein
MQNSKKELVVNSKNDSKIHKHTSMVWIAEPEIIDEEFDIRKGRKFYRVTLSENRKKLNCNEIVSYNYKGIVLLRNPINKELSARIAEMLFDEGKENEWLDTLRDIRQKTFNKKSEIKREKTLKPKGRPGKENIKKASIWCIDALDKKLYKNRPDAIKEAYKEFGEKDVPLKSFARTVGTKIKNITNLYNEKTLKFKAKITRAFFAERFYFAQTLIKSTQKQKK